MKNLLFILLALVVIGCGPRVRVTKVTTNNDCVDGFRYYRPKPYLFVTPFDESSSVTVTKTTTTTIKPGSKYVHMDLQYLPDFTEEYAVQVRPGLGKADVTLELEDGWKLTSVNQMLESKFDENVKAIADAAGTILGATVPTPSATGPTKHSENEVSLQQVVKSTNVPMGYYESVIGRDERGNKQMFGWRYLGFMPYGTCPPNVCGSAQQHCSELDLYGLVFRDGVMEFRQIGIVDNIGGAQIDYEPVEATENKVSVTRNVTGEFKTDKNGDPVNEISDNYQFRQQLDVNESQLNRSIRSRLDNLFEPATESEEE